MGDVDVAVVGAGAAGLAASQALRTAGLDVVTLEAKDRIGGRCWTDQSSFGVPWDTGAHWLHDALNNPLRAAADRLGIPYGRMSRRLLIRRRDGFASDDWRAELEAYMDRAFRAIGDAGRRGEDRPASDLVPDHPHFRAMFESRFAAFNGVEPERMSALDYARSRDGENWPVTDGYGALLARVAANVPVRLKTPVLRIDHRGPAARVETSAGALQAQAVIVTASTSALAAGGITFEPSLPAAYRDAFHALPLGEANKVAFAFARNVFGRDEDHFIAYEHATLEATRFDVRAGRKLAIAYFGGGFARQIEAAGAPAMKDFALERLKWVYGNDIVRHLRSAVATAWCGDPMIRGGYSCAMPGKAEARRTLSVPLGALHFAGEATSLDAYGTVHGAWQRGAAAAARVAGYVLPGR